MTARICTSVKYAFFFGSRLSWKSISVSKMEPEMRETTSQWEKHSILPHPVCPSSPSPSPNLPPSHLPTSPPPPPPHRCWSPGGWVLCFVQFVPPCSSQQTLSELEPRGREEGEGERRRRGGGEKEERRRRGGGEKEERRRRGGGKKEERRRRGDRRGKEGRRVTDIPK